MKSLVQHWKLVRRESDLTMLPKTGNCAPFEQHSNHIPHASPSVVPPCSRQVPNLVPAQPSCNSPREGLLPSKETIETVML